MRPLTFPAHSGWCTAGLACGLRTRPTVCSVARPAVAAAIDGAQQSLSQLGASALAATAVNVRAPFWQLAIAFATGGLFMATVIVALTLAYTLGATNVAKAKVMLRVALRRTWNIGVSMLGAASMALMRRNVPGAPCVETDFGCPVEDVSRWRAAWIILRTGIRQVRSTASEGVQALRSELKLYSAALGTPGLVGFQYLVDKFTPLRFQYELRKALADALTEIRIGSRRFELREFSVGGVPPQLLAARVYDLGPDALGFDVDMSWESELVARLEAVPEAADDANGSFTGLAGGGGRAGGAPVVPVSLRNLRFYGTVRVVVTDLCAQSPGFGAILLSLPAPPEISLDVRIAGADVTKVRPAAGPHNSGHSPSYLPPHARVNGELIFVVAPHTLASTTSQGSPPRPWLLQWQPRSLQLSCPHARSNGAARLPPGDSIPCDVRCAACVNECRCPSSATSSSAPSRRRLPTSSTGPDGW